MSSPKYNETEESCKITNVPCSYMKAVMFILTLSGAFCFFVWNRTEILNESVQKNLITTTELKMDILYIKDSNREIRNQLEQLLLSYQRKSSYIKE